MGATFDRDLIARAGKMLGRETREKGCQILLAPTVCLQRSPLIGRGFEAFGEDPWLSGTLAADYINGVQSEGVGCAIKHYAAHNQSSDPHDDSVWASERTLREVHLLPFQIATRQSNPWTYMTSYHRINGVHTSEDPWLINQILRHDWKWDGLVMSDWFGMCSTAGSLNAGLDLEMPGPTRWRGPLLLWSFLAGKVKLRTIDFAVRNLLNLINRVQPSLQPLNPLDVAVGDTPEKRELCRRIAAESIVLLKNERNILPLDAKSGRKTYGLIGPGALYPAVSGGGSADLVSYYVSKPLDALKELVGAENATANVGCYGKSAYAAERRLALVLSMNIQDTFSRLSSKSALPYLVPASPAITWSTLCRSQRGLGPSNHWLPQQRRKLKCTLLITYRRESVRGTGCEFRLLTQRKKLA
jgi:beta-glucosidase